MIENQTKDFVHILLLIWLLHLMERERKKDDSVTFYTVSHVADNLNISHFIWKNETTKRKEIEKRMRVVKWILLYRMYVHFLLKCHAHFSTHTINGIKFNELVSDTKSFSSFFFLNKKMPFITKKNYMKEQLKIHFQVSVSIIRYWNDGKWKWVE